jgi:CDP-diacylglycerol--glycerol-3-phosphate 3-phosphatidyltransferase
MTGDTLVYEHRQSLISLRRRWLIVALLYAVALLAGYWWLRSVWHADAAMRWLGMATAAMVIQMAILWWTLRHNHRPSEDVLLPFLGYGNGMTLARGLLICMLAGFLLTPQPQGPLVWLPAILYTLERVIDFFDGYVARATRNETKLGAILDIEFDGLGILIASALAIQMGHLPVWYLLLGFARQLFVAGIWLRQRKGKPVYEMSESDHRRLIAGFQTSFISVMLWPILSPQITLPLSYMFAVPLLCSFGRDWLVVSGVIDAKSELYLAMRRKAKQLIEGWLPLVARVSGAGLALLLLWRQSPEYPQWSAHLYGEGLYVIASVLPTLALIWALAALLLLFGVVGRAAALFLFGMASLDILSMGLDWADNGLLLACLVIVLHLGSGRAALWQPEERLLRTKLGAPAVSES